MTITLNGRSRDLADGTTIAALILAETGALRGSAAVVGGEIVPRSAWESTVVLAGQDVEIVTATQGG